MRKLETHNLTFIIAIIVLLLCGMANGVLIEPDYSNWLDQDVSTAGSPSFVKITIFDSIPILVFKDSDSLGAASIGYIEWRDSSNGRAGYFGNASSQNDDLFWVNEQGGNIEIRTTGAGEFKVFADTVLNGNLQLGGDLEGQGYDINDVCDITLSGQLAIGTAIDASYFLKATGVAGLGFDIRGVAADIATSGQNANMYSPPGGPGTATAFSTDAGSGGDFVLFSGKGGNSNSTGGGIAGNTAGVGGDFSLNAGVGGNVGGSHGDLFNTAGMGGGFAISSGSGGNSALAGVGDNLGGAGGAVNIQAGVGGAASNGGTNTGGNAGTVGIFSGTGGSGDTADGTGGDMIFRTGSGSTNGLIDFQIGGQTTILRLLADQSGGYLNGSFGIGSSAAPTADGNYVIYFADNVADPTMDVNTAGIYAKDVSGTVEMFAIDEGDTAAQLTSVAEDEWYDPNVMGGIYIPAGQVKVNPIAGIRQEIDLVALCVALEQVTGQKIITVTQLPKEQTYTWASKQQKITDKRNAQITNANSRIDSINDGLASLASHLLGYADPCDPNAIELEKVITNLTAQRDSIVIPKPYTEELEPDWITSVRSKLQ